MKLFFFGTLMDADVRRIVCGKPLDQVEPASIQGVRRVYVAGRHYPMLHPQAGGRVNGIVVSGIDADSLHRLRLYEGWEYDLYPMAIQCGDGWVTAHVFLCPTAINADQRPWRLVDWQRRYKRSFLNSAPHLMRHAVMRGRFPGTPPDSLRHMGLRQWQRDQGRITVQSRLALARRIQAAWA